LLITHNSWVEGENKNFYRQVASVDTLSNLFLDFWRSSIYILE